MVPMPEGRADGAWCMLGEPLTAARAAGAGFGWLCLDGQHGAFDDAAMVAAMRALAALPAAPPVAVRVGSLGDAPIGRALDAGATIVIVPMIETPEQAAGAVAAAHYPPRGRRSWGPMAPLWGGSAPSADDADPEVWVMIETRAGLDAVDTILAVPGIAGVFVGPFDLALALGLPLEALLEGDASHDPLPRIATAARAAGLRTGAFAGDPARAVVLERHGFDALAVVTDAALLDLGAAAVLGAAAEARTGY